MTTGRRWMVLVAVSLALVLGFAAVAAAQTPLDSEALEIAGSLNCPICQGESVKDSSATLAQEMRALIKKKLGEGESRDEIMQYFVDRYGEGILRDPPRQGFNLVLWWLPVLGFALGAGVFAYVLHRWRAGRSTASSETPELAGISDEDLARYRRQLEEDLRESS